MTKFSDEYNCHGESCKSCKVWEQVWGIMGRCINIHSDHYRHIIDNGHPACSLKEDKE